MKKSHLLILSIFSLASFAINPVYAQSKKKIAKHNIMEPKTLDEVKNYALGEWTSISVELRPTEDRTGSGNIQPTYLKRNFKYLQGDKFVGTITLFADNYGQMPLMEFEFKGNLNWGGAPIQLLMVPGKLIMY